MEEVKKIIDDLAIAALEGSTKLAAVAIMSNSGDIVFQTENFDLKNQENVILNVIKGDNSFILNNSNFTYNTKVPLINFKWSSQNALNYKIVVARDPKFKKAAFTSTLQGKRISTDKLSDGSYYWRVVKTMELSGKKHTTPSKTFTINIR